MLDTLTAARIAEVLTSYTIFGSGYGNIDVFDRSALEWFPVCILGSIIAGIVQLFYAYRLSVFSGSRIAGGIVTLVCAVSLTVIHYLVHIRCSWLSSRLVPASDKE